MPEDGERQQRRNAKRWLWLIVLACLALAGLITYTSLEAPDPASRTSQAPAPPSGLGPGVKERLWNESRVG